MTTRIGIKEMATSQYLKELTFNELCWFVDLLAGGVASMSVTTPPGSPVEGVGYIVPTGATGAWASKVDYVAQWLNGAWKFYTPVERLRFSVADVDQDYIYSGTAWVAPSVGGVPAASETTAGVVEIATGAETSAGSDDSRAVTPLKLKDYVDNRQASTTVKGVIEIATQTEVDDGADTTRAVTPSTLSTFISALTASESAEGIVQLASPAEAITGTNATKAVTPAGVAAVIADRVISAATTWTRNSDNATDTAEGTLATVTLPPLGVNDVVRVTCLWESTNSATVKTARVKLGSTNFLNFALTSSACCQTTTIIRATGATNTQKGHSSTSSGFGTSTNAAVSGSIDMSVDSTLTFACVWGANVAGENIKLAGYLVEILKT